MQYVLNSYILWKQGLHQRIENSRLGLLVQQWLRP